MSISDLLLDDDTRHAMAARVSGVVVGVVTNNKDPDGLGRVKVRFPWLSDKDESAWARVASLMAGNARGVWFLPEVDDEVLVAFDRGDLRFPYVVGALWNGKDLPPAKNEDGKNNLRVIKSRSGHIIRLDDTDGAEKIEIIARDAKHSIVIDVAGGTVEITSDKDITLKAANGTITLDAKTIELKSSADAKVTAGAGMDLKASGTLNVKGATVNIN